MLTAIEGMIESRSSNSEDKNILILTTIKALRVIGASVFTNFEICGDTYAHSYQNSNSDLRFYNLTIQK